MNILIYDVAAESGGALTVLDTFYHEVQSLKDNLHKWYFVVSTDKIEQCDNITVIQEKWVKKSWLHRIWYDKVRVKQLIERYHIDFIFSMQNIPIVGTKCPQVVYLHQSLQFMPVKLSFFCNEEREYWIRKNIICNIMKRHLHEADYIIVQTKWMKEATGKWVNVRDEFIKIVTPKIDLRVTDEIVEQDMPLFLYPAGAEIYKNHELIIEACKILSEKNLSYKVFFTIDPEESHCSKRLYSMVQSAEINIEFVGKVDYNDILKLYKKTILLFPSYLESFGLPLLEAKYANATILCSNMPFSHEILDDYEKAHFFNADNAEQLADYMERCIEGKLEKRQIEIQQNECDESWDGNLVDCVLALGNNLVDKNIGA